jgi:membrane associated rhomboid family serine protease
MNLSISIFIAGLLSFLAGRKKPLHGGIIGLISFLFIFHKNISDVMILLAIIAPLGFLFGMSAGFMSYMMFSNSDDKEINTT